MSMDEDRLFFAGCMKNSGSFFYHVLGLAGEWIVDFTIVVVADSDPRLGTFEV